MPELALAARPGDWDLPLFVHVLGAMVLVGALLTCVVAIVLSRGDARLLRIGWISLLALGLPGWIAMRAGAEWIYSKEGWSDVGDDPAWLGIGFITADLGGALLLAALICGAIGVRKLRGGGGLLMAVNILSVIALAVYVVAIWAMGAKPS